VLEGEVSVCAAVSDVVGRVLGKQALVYPRGTVADGVVFRLVARAPGASLLVWEADDFAAALHACPWVEEDLMGSADSLQALAGATLGLLGELDDELRLAVFEKLSPRSLAANEVLVDEGASVPGLVFVGSGALELGRGDGAGEAGPGDVVLLAATREGKPANERAAAAEGGAVVLVLPLELMWRFAAERPEFAQVLT
jgi:hypothetical protein